MLNVNLNVFFIKRSKMRIEYNCLYGECIDIYNIIEDERVVGSMEIIEEKDHTFLENIYISEPYRGRGFLRECINYFTDKPIVCLPLNQHRDKFRHLGFHKYKTEGSDVYFVRP